ncbi:hypothetical protein HK101_010730 [Irineochytrium annulatum]|nr:hypothetical protein HK101_010730 [Irineochytrium annulatum]
MFSEIFVKTPSNVALLLDILEESDYYVRFNTVQLLSTLLQNLGDRLHESILTSPLGISRLMDLLDDRKEIIRNEGLLLLISLTRSNAEIQKIIAFENAFDRLLRIIREEGATDGGIIVQDCLTLTLNLLRYNVSNQNLFRESSCIQRIPSLLLSRIDETDDSLPSLPLTHESNLWSEQKMVNAVLIFELVRILVGPNNPNTVVNQNIIVQAGVFQSLMDIALSERTPIRVKAQALYAVGEAMRGSQNSQDLFAKHVVQPPVFDGKKDGRQASAVPGGGLPRSALMTVITSAIMSNGDFAVRAAATFCFQSFVHNNPDNQLALAATLTPPPPDNPNEDQGVLEWETAKRDPYKLWFAAVMLSHIIRQNPQCQELALGVRFMDDGDEPISLLHKVMFALLQSGREQLDTRIMVGIMELLSVWLYGCSRAVKEFLSEGSNLQFLIEQINHSSGVDPLVQGMASYLLALCHEFNDDSEPSFTRSTHVRGVVQPKPKEPSRAKEDLQQKSMIESYRNLIATQDRELQEVRRSLAEAEARRTATLISQLNVQTNMVKSLEQSLAETSEKHLKLMREQDDLLVCLAESDMAISQLKQRLRALGQDVESDGEDEEEGEEDEGRIGAAKAAMEEHQ